MASDCEVLEPEGVEVFSDPTRGRGLKSLKRYSKYDEVALGSPDFLVVRHDVYQSYCKKCYKHIKEANICKICVKAYYCSSKCQESDDEHVKSQECMLWEEEPAYPHFSLIQLSLALWRLKNDDRFKSIIEALVSYEDSAGESWDADSEAGLVHWIACIRAFAPTILSPNFSSDAQIRRVYFAIKLNAFNVKPDEASRAHCSGLYSKLALFNHSCDPNCGIQFQSNEAGVPYIRLVALKPIEAGEELSICYTNPYVRASLRRATLKKIFFFDCACSVCSAGFAQSSLAAELVAFCTDSENPINYKIKAFGALIGEEEVEPASVSEAAVAILNSAMSLRGQNALDNETALDVIELFYDPSTSSLRYIRTASPDLYWQWIVFLTDGAMRMGHSSSKKIAALGLETIKILYPNGVPASLIPYISWFASIDQQ